MTLTWRGGLAVLTALIAVMYASLLALAGNAGADRARTETAGVEWGRAEALPGIPAISGSSGHGQRVDFTAVSCWSVHNCAAVGDYGNRRFPFVVTELKGRWHWPEELPGIQALKATGTVSSVACARDGYCAAGGTYNTGQGRAFVVIRRWNHWRAVEEVPGMAALTTGSASVTSVSCPAENSCVVVGTYPGGTFASGQTNGRWHAARQLPGMGSVDTLSCWSAGNCLAGGSAVAAEVNGVWQTAEPVPGAAGAHISSVSCAPDGYCVVGGSDATQAFVASWQDGVLGTAVTWPGSTVLAKGQTSQVVSVSCPAAASCTAAGNVVSVHGKRVLYYPAFVVSQASGVWGQPEALPGAEAQAEITSLSCPTAGVCGAGGREVAVGGQLTEPFVVSKLNGRWTRPEAVPGITALNKKRDAWNGVAAVSCRSAAGRCAAVGTYTDAESRALPFVTAP